MDKKISKDILRQRSRKSIIQWSISLLIVILIFIFLIKILGADVSLKNIIISEVLQGEISISVSATGKVVPLYEEIITSPVATKILSVYKNPGDSLYTGEPILELDLVAFNTDMERQKDELTLKEIKLEQFKATTDTHLSDMVMQIRIDSMKLKRMEVLLSNEFYLDSIGASTNDKVKQTELDYQVQLLQFEQLKLRYNNEKRNYDVDIKSLELDYKIAIQNTSLLQKTMGEAEVKSPTTATLTWVNGQTGATVQKGDQLAIISDLNNFKIECEISDSYSSKISPGNKVELKIGSDQLTGIVGNIVPSVANGMIKFTVILDNSSNPKLRSGLKVDVYVINSINNNALCLDRRSYYSGSGEYYMWVVSGNQAFKREVKLGDSSFDKVEVLSGLEPGEEVILSDMSRYDDRNRIKIKN